MIQGYVEVALPPPVARELTYGVPAELAAEARSGALVLVPVVQRRLTGIVLGPATLGDLPPSKIRPIEQILDTSLLSPEIVALCRWMASYYMAPLGSALMAALPPGVKLSSNRLVQLRDASTGHHTGMEARILDELHRSGSLKVSTLKRRLGSRGLEKGMRTLRRNGHIEIAPVLEDRRPRALSQRCFLLNDEAAAHTAIADIEKRAPRQAACLRYLLDHPTAVRSELSAAGFSSAVLKALEGRGLLEATTEEVVRDPLAHIASSTPPDLVPTTDQQQVLDALSAALDTRKFYPALLQGVTGSGKTLVYVQLAAQALAAGRGAIILVPEIALAWQMVRRFKEEIGDDATVIATGGYANESAAAAGCVDASEPDLNFEALRLVYEANT